MTALLDLGADVEWTDAGAAATARDRARRELGRLADLIEWLAATQGRFPPRPLQRVRLVVVGRVDDTVAGLAADAGVGVRTLDPTGGVAAGAAAADDEIERGADLLVLAADTDPDAAAVVVSALTRAEPVALLPRGAQAVDTARWIARAGAIREGRRRIMSLRARPDELLAALDSAPLAVAAGFVVRTAARRTAMLLDGPTAVAAALLGYEMQARVARWWQLADASPDPVQSLAADRIGDRPLLDLGLTGPAGVAGLLAASVVRAAAAAVVTDTDTDTDTDTVGPAA